MDGWTAELGLEEDAGGRDFVWEVADLVVVLLSNVSVSGSAFGFGFSCKIKYKLNKPSGSVVNSK